MACQLVVRLPITMQCLHVRLTTIFMEDSTTPTTRSADLMQFSTTVPRRRLCRLRERTLLTLAMQQEVKLHCMTLCHMLVNLYRDAETTGPENEGSFKKATNCIFCPSFLKS